MSKLLAEYHELSRPIFRYPHQAKCSNPACPELVLVRGECCRSCEAQQARERVRLRALKSHRRPA